MRITIGQLRKIIRESIRQSLTEVERDFDDTGYNKGYTYGLPGHVMSQVTKHTGKFGPEEIEGSRIGSEKGYTGKDFSIAFTFEKAPVVKLKVDYTLLEDSDEPDKTEISKGKITLSIDEKVWNEKYKDSEKKKPEDKVVSLPKNKFLPFIMEVVNKTKNYIEDNELFDEQSP